MYSLKRSRGRAATLHLPPLDYCFVTLVLLVVVSLQVSNSAVEGDSWEGISCRKQAQGCHQIVGDSHFGPNAASSQQKYEISFKELQESTFLKKTQAVHAQGSPTSKLALQLLDLDHQDATMSSRYESDLKHSGIRHVSRSLLQDNFGEADALLLFKAGIENWTENALDVWTIANRSSYCSWTRVTCNDQLHVISLNFSGLQMNGSLGPSLGKLPYLEDIDLSHNWLYSKLPPEWGELQKLQTLNVHDNYLFGGIPPEYGNMSALREFYLGVQGRFFNGSIPQELGLLSNLEVLALGTLFNFDRQQSYYPYRSNKMIGHIPASIGNCTKLWYLDFYGNNNLTGPIPREFGKLINLEYLSFEQNNFTGSIPSEMGNLTKLKFLHFGNNALSGDVPVSLAGLSQLEFLNFGTNAFTGNFIGVNSTSWSRLLRLFIDGNQFTGGFPPVLTTLTSLEWLYMFNNNFNGSLPSNIGVLSNLLTFPFRSNKFDGELPESLNNCTKITRFDGANNHLNGTLQPIRNLSRLLYLNLGSSYSSKTLTWQNLRGFNPNEVVNSFTGPLTDEMILQWPWLENLYLDTNSFYGSIPKALANLTYLQSLLLNDNQFSGTIPEELGSLRNLTVLYLQKNKLTGTIPAALANLTIATEFNLGNNNLTGPIPPQFGSLNNLQYLRLHRNSLTGTIPPELGQLQNLLYLILHNNQLRGTIPAVLANCSALQNVRLSSNSLIGNVSHINFQRLQNLTSFSVNGNNLSGRFPENIHNCTQLQLLDLSDNQFSGELPNYARDLKPIRALRVLELSNNSFTGSIPSWIWQLSELQVLDLNHNSFGGPLPSDFTGLVGFYTYNPNTDSPVQDPDGGPTKLGPGRRLFEQISLQVKNQEKMEFEYVLDTLISVDLSFNLLSGKLPESLGMLKLLVYLSLSHNNFAGGIPGNLGNIEQLQALDLCFNNLTGKIPLELSTPNVGYLNLSYNALEGQIPHLMTKYNESSFKPGNEGLCGFPLETVCSSTSSNFSNSSSSRSSNLFDSIFMQAFQVGMTIGFVLVVAPLAVIPSLRHIFLTSPLSCVERSRSRSNYGLYREPP